MNVYLVPASSTRHELYCEVESAPVEGASGGTSIWQRMTLSFHRALAEGERARQGEVGADSGRVRRFIVRKLAEAVAEQRLLWHLRKTDQATLVHPDDVPPARAMEEARKSFSADRDKHLRWAIIDGLLIIASAPIALLPGPNVLAYYFIFRTVGHVLSMRGAQQALSRVQWLQQPSADLTQLRAALPLDSTTRRQTVDAIASRLGLERLGMFVDEIA